MSKIDELRGTPEGSTLKNSAASKVLKEAAVAIGMAASVTPVAAATENLQEKPDISPKIENIVEKAAPENNGATYYVDKNSFSIDTPEVNTSIEVSDHGMSTSIDNKDGVKYENNINMANNKASVEFTVKTSNEKDTSSDGYAFEVNKGKMSEISEKYAETGGNDNSEYKETSQATMTFDKDLKPRKFVATETYNSQDLDGEKSSSNSKTKIKYRDGNPYKFVETSRELDGYNSPATEKTVVKIKKDGTGIVKNSDGSKSVMEAAEVSTMLQEAVPERIQEIVENAPEVSEKLSEQTKELGNKLEDSKKNIGYIIQKMRGIAKNNETKKVQKTELTANSIALNKLTDKSY